MTQEKLTVSTGMSTIDTRITPGLIVVVGDCTASFGPLSKLTKDEGYSTEAVSNFEAALKAANTLPCLIVIDRCPDNFDSVRFCRALKSNPLTSSIPILIATGRQSEAMVPELLAAGADEYIDPATPPELARLRILKLLSQQQDKQPPDQT